MRRTLRPKQFSQESSKRDRIEIFQNMKHFKMSRLATFEAYLFLSSKRQRIPLKFAWCFQTARFKSSLDMRVSKSTTTNKHC